MQRNGGFVLTKDILKVKRYIFALRVVKLYRYLYSHNEYVLSKQVLYSDTAVKDLVNETEFAQSKADFIYKLSIAMKEANETRYWLFFLRDVAIYRYQIFDSIKLDIEELIRLLIASIKIAKKIKNNEERIVNNDRWYSTATFTFIVHSSL